MTEILHIYTRVSSLVQSEDGTSLETQKVDGILKAKELGFDHQVWNEGGKSSHSNDIEDRPVLFDLLTEVEKGNVKHLFVYNTDRLSRNGHTWAHIRWKLKCNDVVVYTSTGRIDLSNPMDDLLMGLLSEISQYDNKIRSDRSRRGKFFKVQNGFFQGGPPPFGYKNEKKRLVENVDESQWVQLMFEMYNTGSSVREIRRKLNENGVSTRRGKPSWSLGSINKILRNTIYLGWYDYTDKKMNQTVRVEVPSIVDKLVWESVQSRINKINQRKHQINRSTHFYLLRDFMVCGHCGQKMSGKIGKNNNHYYCPRKERNWVKNQDHKADWVRGKGCTMVRSLNITLTDKVVWDTVIDLVKESRTLREEFRKNFLVEVREFRKKQKSNIKRFEKSHKKLGKELKEVQETMADFETSVLLKRFSGDPDLIREKLQTEFESIKDKVLNLEAEESRFNEGLRWVNWLERFESEIDSKHLYTDEEKKEFLNGVLDQIVVSFDQETNQHSLELDFRLPIVGDGLLYNNPEKHIEGWSVDKGESSYSISGLDVPKGGRPAAGSVR